MTDEVLDPGALEGSLVARAKQVAGMDSTFPDDGYPWVGPFGMDFDRDGRLMPVAERGSAN